MEIKGKAWCMFEQSGTFKNEFKKLGIDAVDLDIQNNFGETDYTDDLFAEIDKAYNGEPSLFDNITPDDIILAFFPCIYFCENNALYFTGKHYAINKKKKADIIDAIIGRSEIRQMFYVKLLKLFGICERRGLRMVFENPYNVLHYLVNNFPYEPSLIDPDRTVRGDYFKKPTMFFFVNCKPTTGCTIQKTDKKNIKTVQGAKSSGVSGVCSEERSMISKDYARNFICDFILGKSQPGVCKTLFD